MKRNIKELMREARKNRLENPQKRPNVVRSSRPESAQAVEDEHPEERELFLRQKAGGQTYYCVLCGHTAVINSQDLWAAHALTKKHKERRLEYIAMATREAQRIKEMGDEEEKETVASEKKEENSNKADDKKDLNESKSRERDDDRVADITDALPKGFFDDAAEEAKIRAEMMSEEDRRRKIEEERREAEARKVEQEKGEVKNNMLQNEAEEEENEKEISAITRENGPSVVESENKKKAAELAGLAERLFKSLNESKSESETKIEKHNKDFDGDNSDDDLDFDWMSKGVCEKRKKRMLF